jgi:putative hydroxymethylpyrimidine transport system substrate-binding protein
MGRMRPIGLLFVVLAAFVAGCGSGDEPAAPSRPAPVTIALDFVPNPVHAPIYLAGDALKIRKPGAGPDGLKLIAAGTVELGVLDIHDLALAREAGSDLVAVGALVGKPLAAVIALPDVARPRELAGRTVGVSGLPSDPAFLRAIVEHDGGDYASVEQVTIGFNAVSRLLTKRVDAVPAFWNAEGVALKERGLSAREFRVEDYGAPAYPEIVLVTSRKTLAAQRARIERALDAIATGLETTRSRPDEAVEVIARAAETDDTGLVRAQLDAVLPVFADGLRLDREVLEQWAGFDARIGLVKERPDVERAFDFSLRGR